MPPVATSEKACLHCGTGFVPTEHRADFCCAGCQFVHRLIAEGGLGQFYDLQTGVVPPVRVTVFQTRDYDWLRRLADAAEQTPAPRLVLRLQGISCLACTWLIEKLCEREPGGAVIRVEASRGRCELRWNAGEFDVVHFAQELQSFGYLLGAPDERMRPPADRGLLIRLGLCGSLAMNTMLYTIPSYLGLEPGAEWAAVFQRLSLVLGTISLGVGGSWFFARAWRSLRAGLVHIDLPISLGLLAAWVGSLTAYAAGDARFVYFDFVSTFTFLMLAGRWLQQRAVERNRQRVLEAAQEPPPVADAVSGAPLPARKIGAGTHFRVLPGRMVPVRARLLSPVGSFVLEWITGESEPTLAREGRVLPGGATNSGHEPVELVALEPWAGSALARLMQATPAAEHRHVALERFLRGYLVAVILIAAAGCAAWWWLGQSPSLALQVLVSVLVVSCPCASGVAIPLCTDIAAAILGKAGVFIRSESIWARLLCVRQIVFDKTGTLTLGSLALENPAALQQLDPAERSLLLGMVQESFHPTSNCLREELLAMGTKATSTARLHEEVGQGVEAITAGATFRLGRPEWCASGAPRDYSAAQCVLARDGKILAEFSFREQIRRHAAREIASFRQCGLGVFILSGDRQEKVQALARSLQVDPACALAELTPTEKADWLRKHQAVQSLYIGDGANDSLAFEVSSVTGTPAGDHGLLEQKADFYFVGSGLQGVGALLATAERRRRVIRAVLAFALLYNLVAVVVSLAGAMSPLLAAILMPISSLVAVTIVTLGMKAR